jgi:hypothetical protein
MFFESKRIPKWSDKNLYELIQEVVSQELSSPRVVNLVEDTTKNVNDFYNEFYEKYATLKKTVSRHVVDKNASSIVLNAEHTVGTEKMRNRFAEVKKYVMEFGFHRLEYEIIEASRTPQGMVDLMYRKRVTSDDFHQIVAGLARWQVLDELQRSLQPMDFSACFAGFQDFRHGGRNPENIYDNVDKERLRDTLEALYHEKYGMTVADGWLVSKASTRDFLLSFMLSLFKEPLTELGGKLASFHRFFTKVCGYAFIKRARNLQIWFYGYQKFNLERSSRASNRPLNEPQNDYNTWRRRFHKYTSIEKMAAWMRNILPQHGIDIA